jgi:mono/diheme cytochrome c family protein
LRNPLAGSVGLAIILFPALYGQTSLELFQQKIRPILSARCQGCHNDGLRFSNLSFDTAAGFRTGGAHGPVVVAGDPEHSRLYRRVARLEKPYMPMQGDALTEDEIGLIRKWIEAGAAWPDDPKAQDAEKAQLARLAALKKFEDRRVITDEDRKWWSFQKPVRPDVPVVRNKALVWNPIDAFLVSGMEAKGLQPAPLANRRTLIRRAYLNLIGLPPRPEEVEAFVNDKSPDAWRKLIDRLLDSEHYGERWGRHWLDVARYADSDGYEYDMLRPHSWRYRDYVIRVFNQDKPYDRFIREQIAGDELPDRDYDSLTGLGFCRNGPFIGDMVLMQNEQTRMDELDDIVATTSVAFLGVTIGCAKCHDHKYDPLAQKDYYRMIAVFAPSERKYLPLAPPTVVQNYESAVQKIDRQIDALNLKIQAVLKPVRAQLLEAKYRTLPDDVQLALKTDPMKRSEAQKLQTAQVSYSVSVADADVLPKLEPSDRQQVESLQAEVAALEKSKPKPLSVVQAITDVGPTAPPSYFLHRGSVGNKGSEMSPGTIAVLNPAGASLEFPKSNPGGTTTGRRLALANWIAGADNPLTARVMVNRIWQHDFGRGIVATPNDFGHMGERPFSQPLLDWLATEFVRQGWSIKAMQRLILNSRAYQQASEFANAENSKIDPENRYLWKMPLMRLESEGIRDSILAVSGGLNPKQGGPGVFPEVDPEVLKGAAYQRWPQTTDGPEMWRRSVYVTEMRTIAAPLLDLFDPPENVTSCPRRSMTTVAPQALQLLNNKFVVGQSALFADRVREEAGRNPVAEIDRAFRLALGRPPEPRESKVAQNFLEVEEQHHRRQQRSLLEQGADPAQIPSPDKAALIDFCHSLLNINEFVYVN